MYLVKRHAHEIDYIKDIYRKNTNTYVYEKTDIEPKELNKLIVKYNLEKRNGVYEQEVKGLRGGYPISIYKKSYYYKLLKFCQSLPMKQHGNILPYFDKYGVRKLKEMYKLSLIVNKDENKN